MEACCGRCPGTKGFSPLRVIWSDSLRAQLVENMPAMQETPVQLLAWEDPLEEGYHLLMQETQIRSRVQKDPTGRGATKPVCHKY